MSDKKRKRSSEKTEQPSKKAAAGSAAVVKVTHVPDLAGLGPVIATAPGVSIPSALSFTPYTKSRGPTSRGEAQTIEGAELLLHSSEHRRIDFTATEGETETDRLVKHYAGIYDPKTGELKLVEARKLAVRSCVREPDSDDEGATGTMYSQRAALTSAFGTKKSMKAVHAMSENALTNPNDITNTEGAPTGLESALLTSMPADEINNSQDALQATVQANKPIPKADLGATMPKDVYPIPSLVAGGEAMLRQLKIQDWIDAIKQDGIKTPSRFVANRFNTVAKAGSKQREPQLRLLKYISILIAYHSALKRQGRTFKLPQRSDLKSAMPENTPDSLLDNLRRTFVTGGAGALTPQDLTLLHTTICALTLHIPPALGNGPNELATDIADIRDDLRLDADAAQKYFRELGCRVDKPREAEAEKWGVGKKGAVKSNKAVLASMRIARLRLPLEFPKIGRGARK